jgi:hypothetical protein
MMPQRNTSSLPSASDAEKKNAVKSELEAHRSASVESNDGRGDMPGLVTVNKDKTATSSLAPKPVARPTTLGPRQAVTDSTMVDGDTDVECSDVFDSLDGDSCFDDDDISLPSDFISCTGCANKRLKETETRLEVTELELTEAQAKLVKAEVQRDAAIALQATLKTELQLVEQAKLANVLTSTPLPLADKQRRELETRLHASEERFLALFGDVHGALRRVKAPRGDKPTTEVLKEVRDTLESAVKRAVVDN